jgi:hypothetical protein
LRKNEKAYNYPIRQDYAKPKRESAVLETATSIIGGLFNIATPESDFDQEQAEFLQQQGLKKKQKWRRRKM